MDPSPIYVSSPGVVVDTTPAYQRLVYITPASTIAQHTVIRDGNGNAATYPIIISTTNGALFRDGSFQYQIDDSYGAFSYTALTNTRMMQLAQTVPADPNFTPSFQYISSAIEPASLNVQSTTTVVGAFINSAPLFTTVLPSPFNITSLSTQSISTTTASTTFFAAGTASPLSTITDYISAGIAVLSSATVYSATVANNAILQSSLTVAGPFTVTSNWSLRGTAVLADISAGANFSTIQQAGIGADISGGSWLTAGFISAATGTITVAGLTQVSSAIVAQTLSTLTATAVNGLFQTLAVGKTTAPLFTLDISGSGQATGYTTIGSLSTAFISAATTTLSSINLINMTSGASDRLNVLGTSLQLNGVAFSTGGDTLCNYAGTTFLASNYIYTSTSIVSSLQVVSTLGSSEYSLNVFGTAHTSSIRNPQNMMMAVGMACNYVAPNYVSSIFYSFDRGVTWNPEKTGGFVVGNDVAWNGRMWVAVGDMGSINGNTFHGRPASTIQYSLDGSNWNSVITGGFATPCNAGGSRGYAGGTGISWNGRMWIATGEGPNSTGFKSTIQYSMDGSNFVAANSATGFVDGGTTNLNVTFRPTWNGRMWLAGRATPTTNISTNNACYSYDGSNWKTLNILAIAGSVLNFSWNGNYWISFGRIGSPARPIAISSNGLNWRPLSSFAYPDSYLNGYAHGGVWDGRKWTLITDPGESGRFLTTSYDTLAWVSTVTSGTGFGVLSALTVNTWNYSNGFDGGSGRWKDAFGNIYWYNGTYYICGSAGAGTCNSIVRSSNGIAWTPGTTKFQSALSVPYRISALAFQSNVESDISVPTLDFNTSLNQFQQYQSTNTINSLSSLITFNNTLFVDSTQATAINTFIPTLSTAYTLYVDGSILTYGAAKLGGATTWTAISDERVKTDISYADISACYNIIKNTHIHAYTYKPEYAEAYGLKKDMQYGVFAQELEQVLPKSVIETDVLGQKMKMVDPSQLNMVHYGASAYIYSTIGQNVSTFAGRNSTISAYSTSISYTTLQNYIQTQGSLSNSQSYLTSLTQVFGSNYETS